MQKILQNFYFFKVSNATAFKQAMKTDVVSLITSVAALIVPDAQPIAFVNVAFSKSGLDALGVTDDLGDPLFNAGQFADAAALNDDTDDWQAQFKGTDIHGVFLVGSNTSASIVSMFANVSQALGQSMEVVYELDAASRNGTEAGHEHFGFLDGVSNPGVQGFTNPIRPGQSNISKGIILCGTDGDMVTRPPWATDGSFLAFRKLRQLVPEFQTFLQDNALQASAPGQNLSQADGAGLLGARIVGRWPSGAPIDLTPFKDDPALGADQNRNNNFTFDHPEIPGFNITTDESRCPFAAHVRKTRPRSTLLINGAEDMVNQAIRAGIPYGPEVTDGENSSNTTSIDRGLAFVMYQSDLSKGFHFLQQAWVDTVTFPPHNTPQNPGFDLLIGQAGNDAPRNATGMDPTDFTRSFTMQEVVVSNGGEYFFSPSISALSDTILA